MRPAWPNSTPTPLKRHVWPLPILAPPQSLTPISRSQPTRLAPYNFQTSHKASAFGRQLKHVIRLQTVRDTHRTILSEEVLQDLKVRFVPSFVVITFLWSSLPQIHKHCFSNAPYFTAYLLIHFPSITSDRSMEPTPFSPAPLSPCLSTGVTTYGTTSHPMPNVFSLVLLSLYATGILKDKAGVSGAWQGVEC